MSHSPEEIRKHIKVYTGIFIALLVLTVLTVGVSYVHLGKANNIAVGLLIATVKASLVALFFMHLLGEKRLVYWVMGFTMFFFAGLIFLTLLDGHSEIKGTMSVQPAVAEVEHHSHGEEHH